MTKRKRNISVCFSVTNCVCYDQRVLRMAGTVIRLNCDVTLVGRQLDKCCETGLEEYTVRRFRMLFNNGFLFYAFYQLRLFFFLLLNRFDLLVANDLDTLLPNYLASVIKRIPLVYDSHEYFTGVPELSERPFVRGVWKRVERLIFPKLKYVITVSDGIAVLYLKEYGIRPLTVMNCSMPAGDIKPLTRTELGVNGGELIAIIQGTGINTKRGGEELVEAVAMTPGVCLFVIGSGSSLKSMKRIAHERNAAGRIRFIGKLPWEQMMRYTKAADAGFSLDSRDDINSLYSLPNKLFDYLGAGIAVIAGDLPEVGEIIRSRSCGLILEKITAAGIAEELGKLIGDRTFLHELKLNALKASETLNWKTESEKVSQFYKRVLEENGYF